MHAAFSVKDLFKSFSFAKAFLFQLFQSSGDPGKTAIQKCIFKIFYIKNIMIPH